MAFTHECQSNIMAEDSEMPITAYLHVDLSETRKQKVCDRFCCNFSLTMRKPALHQLQMRLRIYNLSMHVRLAWAITLACRCLKAYILPRLCLHESFLECALLENILRPGSVIFVTCLLDLCIFAIICQSQFLISLNIFQAWLTHCKAWC